MHVITRAAFRSRATSSAVWSVRVLKVPTLSPVRSFRSPGCQGSGHLGVRVQGPWVPGFRAPGCQGSGPLGVRVQGPWVSGFRAPGCQGSGPLGARVQGPWVPGFGAPGCQGSGPLGAGVLGPWVSGSLSNSQVAHHVVIVVESHITAVWCPCPYHTAGSQGDAEAAPRVQHQGGPGRTMLNRPNGVCVLDCYQGWQTLVSGAGECLKSLTE